MKKFIVGNWKMNHTLKDIREFFSQIGDLSNVKCESWIAPQFIHIPELMKLSEKNKKIKVGAQNCSNMDKGAFTGEVSPLALKDLGIHFVVVGHSERRAIYGEDDRLLNEKVKLALSSNLTVIFCVGETLEERESDETFAVLKRQVNVGLASIPKDKLSQLLIAYEPVWAIGTGKTATKEQAEDAHKYVRGLLAEQFGEKGKEIPILYGGSVKPTNIAELLSQKNVDGALIGGASLIGKDYLSMCQTGSKL